MGFPGLGLWVWVQDLVVSTNSGPQCRPPNTLVLIIETPKTVPLILGNPHLNFLCKEELSEQDTQGMTLWYKFLWPVEILKPPRQAAVQLRLLKALLSCDSMQTWSMVASLLWGIPNMLGQPCWGCPNPKPHFSKPGRCLRDPLYEQPQYLREANVKITLLGLYWGFVGIMKNKMVTAIYGLGFRVLGFRAEKQPRVLKCFSRGKLEVGSCRIS